MKRREFLKRSSLSVATAWAGSSLLFQSCHTEEDMIGKPNWIVEGNFERELIIPSQVEGGTTLSAQQSMAEMIKGRMSSALSYGQQLLGPTIVATPGVNVNIALRNNLNEDTNIHWHGLILPENMDGHPKDVARPGETLNYSLPILQRAGTYWYHPHPHGQTAKQVFMGLAGMFIVRDAEESALNLPSDEFELPLIIQDKRFEGNQLKYAPTEDEIMSGYLGEQIIVNGVHSPLKTVRPGWYRLRILNGSTARVYNLALTGGLSLKIIGADGGLLRSPETVNTVMLGPGERIDALVDFTHLKSGSDVFLISNAFSKYNAQGRQSFKIMKFRVEGTATQNFTLPDLLSSIDPLQEASALKTRTFDIAATANGEGGHGGMGRHSINAKIFDMHRVDETVTGGSIEIWEFDNQSGDEIHPMHIHGVQFQVLSRIGGRGVITPAEKGWKDTILVMPREKVRVIMKFPEYKGVFVFHCHNLEHEDDGMMLNYEII